jgi:Ca2+-binding RTX toxin-like protein
MGNDTLIGGAGNDTFVIDAGRYSGMSSGSRASAGIDTILDFSPADDTIQLGKEIFRNLTQGFLNPDAFSSSGAATLASHRIIYDQTTGGLSYDADGSGLGGSVAFATLMTKPANVTAADFLVI